MAKAAKKRRAKSGPAVKNPVADKHRAEAGRQRSVPVERPSRQDEAAHTDALLQSGQVAPADHKGPLPRGVTHKAIEQNDGTVKVVRRRFSIG